MKYLLFAGPTYYPGGGVVDYVGKYETLDEAKAAFAEKEDCNDWAHIVDADTMAYVLWYSDGLYRGEQAGWRAPR